MSGRMPRPYVDRPEPEPPNPVRRRTGSFPVRSLSGDNQQPILPPGTRPPRRFVATSARVFVDEGSDDYRTAPAAVPGFSREGTFGNQSQPWHRQDSGVQYVGGYLPADAPPPNASEWIYERTPYLYRPRRTTSRNSPEDVPFLGGGERLYRSRSPSPEQAPDRRAAVEIRAKRARRYSSSDDEGDPSSDQEEEDRELRQRSATFSDDVSVVDDYIAAKVYQFSPSRLSRNPSDEPSIATAGSDGEGPPPDADQGLSDQDEVPPPTKATRVLDVYLSEYTGDAYADGSHSARLTAVHDPKKAKQPLFRWIHIKQSTLDFDALSIDIARLSGLADSDKNGLAKLLAEVKKTCIKTTPSANGTNIKWMEPKFVQVPLPPDQISKGRNSPVRFVTWLCIPYFSLEKYSGPLSTAQSATFPTQTLLQAQYSGVPKDRDMQQVVCQLGHVPPETCFHINQLWCIVLDNCSYAPSQHT
ncbi:hypothetical protein VTK73DRAFT_8720 [Phialemonium thermophilum]|uniref:Uncharacterized protein n=1 Tax=Phialemonium thermophilum TaxID=223376 RepID=A0ABR3XP99_9PEZI